SLGPSTARVHVEELPGDTDELVLEPATEQSHPGRDRRWQVPHVAPHIERAARWTLDTNPHPCQAVEQKGAFVAKRPLDGADLCQGLILVQQRYRCALQRSRRSPVQKAACAGQMLHHA